MPFSVTWIAGPPPRAWGELLALFLAGLTNRSTPTRVGRTGALLQKSPPSPVHPHARGENVDQGDGVADPLGPPPRAWGELPRPPKSWWGCRSTPTRVGRTYLAQPDTTGYTVHPHARGENCPSGPQRASTGGPPPRAWGERLLRSRVLALHRSTPTRVGRTTRPGTRTAGTPVHPHARGENSASTRLLGFPFGPPPRAWGERLPGDP